MKKLIAATTALTLLTSAPVLAQDAAPTMDVEIVTQDARDLAADDGMLVPLLTMVILLLISTGGGSGYGGLTACAPIGCG